MRVSRPDDPAQDGTERRQSLAQRSRMYLAEREGFEPPIGLHLCRISSAVRSTTLPPLQAIENIVYIGMVEPGRERQRPLPMFSARLFSAI